MITQKQLDDVEEELKKAAIPTKKCHFCGVPVYRMPFQESPPKVDNKIMCLQCLGLYEEYKKLNY